MADGRDDNYNIPPNRGAKLRMQGSRPTGTQEMSFKPEYSDEMDYTEGGMTPISGRYARTRAKDENHNAGWGDLDPCCKDLGLNLKEPL